MPLLAEGEHWTDRHYTICLIKHKGLFAYNSYQITPLLSQKKCVFNHIVQGRLSIAVVNAHPPLVVIAEAATPRLFLLHLFRCPIAL